MALCLHQCVKESHAAVLYSSSFCLFVSTMTEVNETKALQNESDQKNPKNRHQNEMISCAVVVRVAASCYPER